MRQEDYPPGTIVFAKLKGYPWWPARVEDEKRVPAKVMKQKSTKSKGPVWTVFFFGSRDYGFFGPDAIRPFDSQNVERDLKAKKFKTKELENAVRQALDPSLLEEEEQDEDDAEDEEEEVPTTTTKKSTRGRSKAAAKASATGKKKAATAAASKRSKSRSKDVDEEEEEEEEEEVQEKDVTKTKRRSRKLDEADNDTIHETDAGRKKRRKSVSSSDKEEGRVSPATTPRHSSESEKPKDESAEYEKERARMYRLRHKLQKLVYQKKPGEIPKEDYPHISQILKSVEESHMTPQLLRDTKIGQVVKSAGLYGYEDDAKYSLQARARQLMSRWRESFASAAARQHVATTENGSNGNRSASGGATAASTTPEPQPKTETQEEKKQDTMQANEESPATTVENKASETPAEGGGEGGEANGEQQPKQEDCNEQQQQGQEKVATDMNGDGAKAEPMAVDADDETTASVTPAAAAAAAPAAPSVDTVMQEAS